MRRAAFAVLRLPGAYPGQRLAAVRWTPSGARLLAVLAAGVVAAALAVMVAAGPVAREQVSRSAASARLPVAAWGPVSGALGRDDPAYGAAGAGARFVARGPRQRLWAQFSPAGVSIRSGAVLLGVRLRGYGYGDRLEALGAVAPTARANRVLYRHGSLSEWYANGPLGLEQGFTWAARPAGRRIGPLTLALSLSGNARGMLSRGRNAVTFSHGASSLSYGGLIVTDARGRTLPAWLQLRGGELLLRVRDAGARYPLRVDPFIQQAKLTASDGGPNTLIGFSVAVSHDTIAAAAPFATVYGNAGQGVVYVFVKPKRGWASATETAKLTASDGAAGDFLGGAEAEGSNAVGISGDTIVAGAPTSYHAGPGAVYVFVKPKCGWRSETETAKLTASDAAPGDNLGWSAGISGDTVVGAAPEATINGNQVQGAVYVFLKPKGGWRSETETAKLTASDGAQADTLGWCVAISHDTVVAGAPGARVNGNYLQGAAYVFVKPKGGWRSETETAKLTASDGAARDFLGLSVGISHDTVVAGAPTQTGTNPGAAYVFVKPKGGWRSETETAKLTASDGIAGSEFGTIVGVSGDTFVARSFFLDLTGQAQGAVYVFEGRTRDSQTRAVNHSLARNIHRPPALPRSWYKLRRARRSACVPGPRIITILARIRPCTASPVRSRATGRRAGIR